MPKLGSLKNPSPAGARPVKGPPPARRCRKRPRSCKRGWTSWRCCRTTPNGSDTSSNFAAPWARSCFPPKESRRRKRVTLMPARELWEQLGSPSEFLQVPHGQSLHHAFRGELDLAQRLDE